MLDVHYQHGISGDFVNSNVDLFRFNRVKKYKRGLALKGRNNSLFSEAHLGNQRLGFSIYQREHMAWINAFRFPIFVISSGERPFKYAEKFISEHTSRLRFWGKMLKNGGLCIRFVLHSIFFQLLLLTHRMTFSL